YNIIVVALPKSNDENIKVANRASLCITGTFYYDDNTSKDFDAYKMQMELLTKEWAEKHILGYCEGMKILPVYGVYNNSTDSFFDNLKANQKIIDKLSALTRWEFNNKHW
ncbi:MAG: hypothetical protein RR355_00100, partial [Oscillospiraceae bacterium]